MTRILMTIVLVLLLVMLSLFLVPVHAQDEDAQNDGITEDLKSTEQAEWLDETEATETELDEDAITLLVADYLNGDRDVRLAARQQLRAIGAAAIPFLEVWEEEEDISKFIRIHSLISMIESDAIRQQTLDALQSKELDSIVINLFDEDDLKFDFDFDFDVTDLQKQMNDLRKRMLDQQHQQSRSLSGSSGMVVTQTFTTNGNQLSFTRTAEGDIRVTVQDKEDNEAAVYEADSWEEFAETYPDIVREYSISENGLGRMGNSFTFTFQSSPILQRHSTQPIDPAKEVKPLGLRLQLASELVTAHLNLTSTSFVIEDVKEDSFAETLGLRRWDLLIGVNGDTLTEDSDPAAAIKAIRDAGEGSVTVLRKGETLHLSLDDK